MSEYDSDAYLAERPRLLVLIREQGDVSNALIVLVWWTLSEELQDEALEVDVRIHDWCQEEVVDIQDVRYWRCEVAGVQFDVELSEHLHDVMLLEVVKRRHLLWW